MDSKTLTTIIVVFICVLLFPLFIGIIGGIFGLIGGLIGGFVGLVGALFGAIFGVIGSIFGAIFGVFGWIFDDHFHWPHIGFFNGELFIVIALVILIAMLSRSRRIHRPEK